MKKQLALALCLLLAAGATTPILSQSKPVRAGESIQVTLVEVPVNVYDRSGNPIRGLTAADFELTDDGKKRDITHFEEIDLAKVAADKSAPPPAAARRNFMLLFDLSNSTPTTIGRSREAALDFVKNELTATDVAAVATYSVEKSFRLLTNFTSDRDALVAAITTLGNPKFFKAADPLMLGASMTGTGMQQALMDSRSGKTEEATSGAALRDAEFVSAMMEADQASARADDEYRRGRVNQQIKAFGNIGRALDSISGRKQIILLSEGFDARLVQGRDVSEGSSKQSMEEADKILNGQGYETNSDERFGNTTAANMVSTMGELLKRSDVVLHAIDIKGLRGAADAAGGKRSSNEGLYVLTRPTGGEVFKNANDLSSSFQALMKQQEVVYVLGFQASGNQPGKFHNLKVKVRTAGAKTSFRSGYYEANPTVSPLEATLSAGEILLNDVAFDAVKTNVIASAFPVKGANPQVPVIVEIDGKSLAAGAKNNVVNADLFVYAFDRDNKIKDFLFQRVGLDMTKVGEQLQKSGLKYYGTLSLPPGDYAIKTLVRLPDAALDGFKRANLTVPDFTQATPTVLQPVPTEAAGQWLMMRGAVRPGQNFAYPFAVAADSFVPTGTWHISQAAPQRLALFTFNVDPKDLAFTGKLKTADGNARDVSVSVAKMTPPDASRAAQLLLDLKADGLPRGTYALDLAVQPKSGGWTKTFTIPVYVQ